MGQEWVLVQGGIGVGIGTRWDRSGYWYKMG